MRLPNFFRKAVKPGTLVSVLASVAMVATLFTGAAAGTKEESIKTTLALRAGAPALPGAADLPELQTLAADERNSLLEQYRDSLKSVSGISYDANRAEALQAGDLRLLRLPAAAGQGIIEPSSLTVFIDASGNSVSLIQTAFYPQSGLSGRAKIWADGKLTFNEVVEDPNASGAAGAESEAKFTTASFAAAKAPNGYKKGDWWGNLNKCLSAAGIAGWAIAALSTFCAIACVGTAGAACVPCLAALTGGTGGVISYCVHDASYYS